MVNKEDPFARFGITKERWGELQRQYRELVMNQPPPGDHETLFSDWEAELLRKIFEHFGQEDPNVCALLANMMNYIIDRNYYTGSQR